jgi:hypothetical protein
MSLWGQSLPGRAGSNSGHVRYALESGSKLACCDMPLPLDGDALDVISSQQPIENVARCRSVSLARTVSDRCGSRPFHLFTLLE